MVNRIIVFLFMILVLNNSLKTQGDKLYSNEGDDVRFNMTLTPVPDNDTTVTISHHNVGNIMIFLGTKIIIPQTMKGRVVNTDGTNSDTGTVVFTLLNVTRHDAGQYNALYTYQGKSISQDAWTLLVYYAASILSFTSDPKGPNVSENTRVVLVCEADGYPPPNVTISYENKTLDEVQTSRSLLELSHIDCSQTGTYQCDAGNDIGSDKQEMLINVLCVPNPAVVLKANCIGTDKAEILWLSSYNGGDEQSFIIAWKVYHSENFTMDTRNYTDPGQGHTRTEVIKGLSENTVYLFTVFALNSIGFANISGTVSCTTEGVPNPAVVLKANCIGTDKAEILWISNYNGGDEQSFIIAWKVYHSENFTMDTRNYTDPGQGHTRTEVIKGLSANTVYLFTVFALNSNGFANISGTVSCTTEGPTSTGGGHDWRLVCGILGVMAAIVVMVITLRKYINKKQHPDRERERLVNSRTDRNDTNGTRANQEGYLTFTTMDR